MAQITVNGSTVIVKGAGNICISNGKVTVDGENIDLGYSREIRIVGNVGEVKCDESVYVDGNVTGNVNCKGSCHCKDVGGDVYAGGSIHAVSAMNGKISAGGSVHIHR